MIKIKFVSAFAILCLLFSFNSFAQTSSSWTELFGNNREEALSKIESDYKSNPSLENLLVKEIIRNENGQLTTSKNFLELVKNGENFEPYLYSLWNESFFFDNYLNIGFDNESVANVINLYESDIKSQTLNQALIYLKGITDRHLNDFDGYKNRMDDISSIKNWQYCGAFENLNNSGLDAIYGPENHAVSREDFNANSNGFLNWYNEPGERGGYQFFGNHSEYGAGVQYAQSFFNNESERDVYVRVGNSSKFKLWINDALIYEQTKDLDTDLDAYNVKVTLPAGDCRILMKLAEPSGAGYFIVRITDESGKSIEGLNFSRTPNAYKKSSVEKLNPTKVNSEIEDFFLGKKAAEKDNFFIDYCLIRYYLRNGRYEDAEKIIEPTLEKYPKSSFLRSIMILIHSSAGENTEIKEIVKNLQQDDEFYHISLTYKFQNFQELFRMDMAEMNQFLDDYANSMDSDLIKVSAKMVKSIRLEDKKGIKSSLDKLLSISQKSGNAHLARIYAPLYGSILSDEAKSIALLKELNEDFFDYNTRSKIRRYYSKRDEKSKVLEMYKEDIKNRPNEIDPLNSMVYRLHDYEKYKESLPYIDRMLEIYPYSFVAMEYKGDALLQLNKKEEAIEAYKNSLIYNTGNTSLRKKIRDIGNESDIVEDYKIEDVYSFIKEHRGKITENNYGYNFLLDESIVELYAEAGGKSRFTYVFEVTSDQGVENLKEYNLGLRGSYNLIKSEAVKADGSISPAERSGSQLVFANLEIGDVIYIDYQKNFNGTGRFYKDYVESYRLEPWHPSVLATFTLIAPKDKFISFKVENGELDQKITEVEKHKVYNWKLENDPGLELYEDYMPEVNDVAKVIHISTIDSWNEIANWYSDLVRPQIEVNADVQKVHDEIFKDVEIEKLSDTEKAKLIYYYMMNNYTYSSVSFRQSGFIPQKPAKTITSKLGDCKDFSALFLTLAQMVDLNANMVLVLTSDNGQKSTVLPSQDFNHCIVRVDLDGEERYLELTDKYLPFLSLPSGVRNSTVLNIPYTIDEAKTFDLITLKNPARIENIYQNSVKMNVSKESQKLVIDTKAHGAIRTFYAESLESPNYKVVYDYVEGRFNGVVSESIEIDTVKAVNVTREDDWLSFTTELTINEKINKIGSFYILKVPYIANAYHGGVVSEKERDYTINYLDYESTDAYIIDFDIHLEEGKEFIEIPENKDLKFKNHTYKRTFTKVSPSHLKISIVAKPGKEDVTPDEYLEFKTYVNEVLEAKDEFIGFK